MTGGSIVEGVGNFVQPTVVEISHAADVVKEELFGPVLYVFKFEVCFTTMLYIEILRAVLMLMIFS